MRFTIHATPTAQQRARHATRNGFSVSYKSKEQQANERTLEAMLMEHRPTVPASGPLALEFVACFPVPASKSKKQKEAMLKGDICHTQKPDLDNLAKQLKDAMTRMQFWNDDKQVVEMRCRKKYAEFGRWEVTIQEVTR